MRNNVPGIRQCFPLQGLPEAEQAGNFQHYFQLLIRYEALIEGFYDTLGDHRSPDPCHHFKKYSLLANVFFLIFPAFKKEKRMKYRANSSSNRKV